MSEPLITIAITCFNAENSIERAIKSAVGQNWINKEIIVVDDCSSDNSCEIVSRYPEVTLIRHEKNMGASGARNTLIREARGEFIAFFDDDDESLPNRIETQYKRIIGYSKSEMVMCFASGVRKYPNGYELKLHAIGCDDRKIPYGDDFMDRFLFLGGNEGLDYGSGTPTCSLMVRKKIFEDVGCFDEKLRRVEDLDFAIRAAIKGAHFIGCYENLLTQYSTETGDKAPEKNLEAELILVSKHKKYLLEKGRYLYAMVWPKIRCFHFQKKHIKMILTLGMLFLRHPVWVSKHILNTGTKRIRHENKMKAKKR